jgi:hypothetical protein
MIKDNKDIKKQVDKILSLLDGEEREKLKARLSGDPNLAELVDTIGPAADQNESAEWRKLESAAHLLLQSLLKDVHSAGKTHAEQQGVLTFDSRLLPLPEGVRPATVDTRRLRYQVGDNRLEMSLYPVSVKSYELIGQLGEQTSESGFSVELTGLGKALSVTADRYGVFRFPRVTCGKYRLRISEGGKLIAVVDLEI